MFLLLCGKLWTSLYHDWLLPSQLNVTASSNYKKYGGFDNVVRLLEKNGYELYAERKGTVVVYHKSQT